MTTVHQATEARRGAGRGLRTQEYLRLIGVAELPALTSPFDPGYDPVTVESHLGQSAHLMASLKISMSCWMIARERATRAKIAAARVAGVPAVAGGGPFEIAVAQGALEPYLDLCAELGFDRIECASGFTTMPVPAARAVRLATSRRSWPASVPWQPRPRRCASTAAC